ncbi:MAG TPA: FtsX-like permease family protein [Steroidobacteraceae bacterium]|nr:FtsX-like permease family protein [Steroidobacteraceae bacterium]
MSASSDASAVAWRILCRLQWHEQPLRALLALLAVALGVALGSAVYLINAAALDQFNQATRRITGDADLIVQGPASGFDETLFVQLARNPGVAEASPLLQLQLALPASTQLRDALAAPTLPLLALDPFRAASMQTTLISALGGDVTELFDHDAVVLTQAAANQLGLSRGSALPVIVGNREQMLRVIDVLPGNADPEPLAIMDIAAAQWVLGRLGRLDRVDLRLRSGVGAAQFARSLRRQLPAGVVVTTPGLENERARSATRAYRVNLNMLALVALLTGAFLVFTTQSLAVLRRRVILGLLRALGVTQGELLRALLAEGLLIGIAGSLLGVLFGALFAGAVLDWLGADLGNRQFAAIGASFALHPLGMLAFALLGTLAAALGGWVPAREAARRAPAAALKPADVEPVLARLPRLAPGLSLLLIGGALAWLPPLASVPVGGYAAVGCLLLGAVLLVPLLVRVAFARLPGRGGVVLNASIAHLRGSAGAATIGLAGVIVSFSLMVAMAIMVHSFRDSFERWLVTLLPADLTLRADPLADTATLSASDQTRLATLPEIARAQFMRLTPLYLSAGRAPVTLIARSVSAADAASVLPLVQTTPAPAGARPAWVSEPLRDLYGIHSGQWLDLPLAGRTERFFVAGVWRDYVRPAGAVVIRRADYVALTADRTANEAALWQRAGNDTAGTESKIRALLPHTGALQMFATPELRERSLQIFDRAFLVTYALEAVAVLIGLAGISMASSAATLARRGQFGMLRHLGMLRRQVLGMIAYEGVLQSALAVISGLALGGLLSVILVYVINRESFHWSIDLAIPWGELAALGLALIATAALTAWLSGRAALGEDVIRAVREDW